MYKKILYSFFALATSVMLLSVNVNAESIHNHQIAQNADTNNNNDDINNNNDDNDMDWGWIGLAGLLGLLGLRRRNDR